MLQQKQISHGQILVEFVLSHATYCRKNKLKMLITTNEHASVTYHQHYHDKHLQPSAWQYARSSTIVSVLHALNWQQTKLFHPPQQTIPLFPMSDSLSKGALAVSGRDMRRVMQKKSCKHGHKRRRADNANAPVRVVHYSTLVLVFVHLLSAQ